MKRLVGLALILGAGFAALSYRLVDLQVLQHESLKIQARNNTLRRYVVEPRRGDILDVRGHPLAMSVPVKRVCADPGLIGTNQAQVAKVLAPLIQWDEARLVQALAIRTRVTTNHQVITNRFVDLKRKVNIETWQQITQSLANLTFVANEKKLPPRERSFYRDLRRKAIYAMDDYHRVYPSKNLAAHVLGFTGTDEKQVNERLVAETIGQDGIEQIMQSKLCGSIGWRVTEKDNKNRELVAYREQDVEARPGLNTVLTLDMVLQHVVEIELAEAVKKHTPISASAIIVRPRTGEILAMATLPNYDPNRPGDFDNDCRRNRVITDLAEPGSTFKIVVVSGALNERAVSLTDSFDCENGKFVFCGKTLHDDHGGHGVLTGEQVLTKSSNIGAAKIGIRLGEPLLHQYIRNFGFGTRTGIPLGGEVNGIVHPLNKWTKLSVSRIPMGHEVAVTPLQMVMAMSAIANGGKLMRPMLINRLQNQEGEVFAQYAPQAVRQVIREATARQMVEALKTVTTKGGTAEKAALEHYTVAGKTGTAQKVVNGQYVTGKYFSSFIGFFPADAPELCISVVLDEPKNGHYGGQTAAPFFKNIAEQAAKYLNIRPDRLDTDAESMAVIIDANSPPKTLTQRAP